MRGLRTLRDTRLWGVQVLLGQAQEWREVVPQTLTLTSTGFHPRNNIQTSPNPDRNPSFLSLSLTLSLTLTQEWREVWASPELQSQP